MKIKTNEKLNNLAGKPMFLAINDGAETKKQELDLRLVLTNVLLENDADADAQKKFTRYQLAQKIHTEDEVDLPVEDIQDLKALVAKHYNPIVQGAVWAMLDPVN